MLTKRLENTPRSIWRANWFSLSYHLKKKCPRKLFCLPPTSSLLRLFKFNYHCLLNNFPRSEMLTWRYCIAPLRSCVLEIHWKIKILIKIWVRYFAGECSRVSSNKFLTSSGMVEVSLNWHSWLLVMCLKSEKNLLLKWGRQWKNGLGKNSFCWSFIYEFILKFHFKSEFLK